MVEKVQRHSRLFVCPWFCCGLKLLGLVCLSFVAELGCVKVDGGSVEARWLIQCNGESCCSTDGNCWQRGAHIGCSIAGVSSVALSIAETEGGDELCTDLGHCKYRCDREVGATSFEIPSGSYLLALRLLDSAGADLSGDSHFVLPVPLRRDIRWGEVTEMHVALIQFTP